MAVSLTEQHRLMQLRLGALTVRQLAAAFAMLDPSDLDGTFQDWLTVVTPIVGAARSTSSRLAAGFLTAHRVQALGPDPDFVPTLARPVDTKALATSLLVTGPISIRSNLARMMPFDKAVDTAKAYSSGAGMRHALNGGRETITRTVTADKRAAGYQRVASGNACEFCSMLADRGAVYGAESGNFAAHDRCGCTAEPVYR